MDRLSPGPSGKLNSAFWTNDGKVIFALHLSAGQTQTLIFGLVELLVKGRDLRDA
jgi:hypothetical protein